MADDLGAIRRTARPDRRELTGGTNSASAIEDTGPATQDVSGELRATQLGEPLPDSDIPAVLDKLAVLFAETNRRHPSEWLKAAATAERNGHEWPVLEPKPDGYIEWGVQVRGDDDVEEIGTEEWARSVAEAADGYVAVFRTAPGAWTAVTE